MYLALIATITGTYILQSSVLACICYILLCASTYFATQRMWCATIATFLFCLEFYVLFPYLQRKPDGIYYEQLLQIPYPQLYDTLIESTRQAYSNLQLSELKRGFFLLLSYPFINSNIFYENYAYLPINFLTLMITAIFYNKLIAVFCANHHIIQHKTICDITTAMLIISPTIIMHSHELLKDLIVLMLIQIAVYNYTQKNILLFIGSMFLAFLSRTYSPLIIALYILAIKKPHSHDYTYIIIFIILMLILTQFNISALTNMLLSLPYIFINPMPLTAINWQMPVAIATIGGLIHSLGLIGAIRFLISPKAIRAGLNRLPLTIFLFATLLAAIGYNNITNFEMSQYSIGTLGDNNFRKIIPILPLVILQFFLSYHGHYFVTEVSKCSSSK